MEGSVVDEFQLLSRYLSGGTEENSRKPQSVDLWSENWTRGILNTKQDLQPFYPKVVTTEVNLQYVQLLDHQLHL
jgi:hypothetical protein